MVEENTLIGTNDRPVFTIVTLDYRRPVFSRRATHSAMDQTFVDLHVGVSENASGEGMESEAADFAARDLRVFNC